MTSPTELLEEFRNCMPLFMALGDETRLYIIEVLSREAFRRSQASSALQEDTVGMNVNEITQQTSLSRPAISHHLKILKDAGLVGVRQEGTANYYYLTLRESNRQLMGLGYRLQEFLY